MNPILSAARQKFSRDPPPRVGARASREQGSPPTRFPPVFSGLFSPTFAYFGPDFGLFAALTGDHPEYLGWVPLERVLDQKPY